MKLLVQMWTAIVIVTASCSSCCAQEGSIFEAIGRAIRQALGDEDPPAEVAQERAMQAGPDGVLPAEKDREELKSRLTVYSKAMEAWVVEACAISEDQRPRVQELFDATVATEVERFANLRDPNRRNQSFSETFPVLFTREERPAEVFSDRIVTVLERELLTDQQKGVLREKLKERTLLHQRGYLNYVVALIDQELYLTKDQRDSLAAELAAGSATVRHPLYAFQPQSYYLPYEAISSVLPKAVRQDFLEPSQKKRLQDLNGSDPNSQHIIFQASSGVEGWYQQMNEASLQQRDKFLRAAAVRVHFYQKELDLNDQQTSLLVTASKGAAVRAIGDWKETTQQTFEQMEQQIAQMGGNFGFGAQNVDTRQVDQSEIWTDAVRIVSDSDSYEKLRLQRIFMEREAAVESVLALLDEEMWLQEEQRFALKSAVEKALPRSPNAIQHQEYIREVILIAHPLFGVSESARDEILSEPQREVWKQLLSYFRWQKENNYVQIPLRNNGGSFGFMLER